jgi:hypothetical protein
MIPPGVLAQLGETHVVPALIANQVAPAGFTICHTSFAWNSRLRDRITPWTAMPRTRWSASALAARAPNRSARQGAVPAFRCGRRPRWFPVRASSIRTPLPLRGGDQDSRRPAQRLGLELPHTTIRQPGSEAAERYDPHSGNHLQPILGSKPKRLERSTLRVLLAPLPLDRQSCRDVQGARKHHLTGPISLAQRADIPARHLRQKAATYIPQRRTNHIFTRCVSTA